MDVTLLTESELRRAARLDPAAIDAVADGFDRLERGEVVQPPILRVDVPEHRGEVDVKSAYVRGWDSFAVKLSSGFFGNPARGLPSASGMMVLLSAETGVPRALLLDNGYLTDLRTALAGAVAARWLAPARVARAGIVGAGAQARWQLRALARVRGLEEARVWARSPDKAAAFADEMTRELGLPVEATGDLQELVETSRAVVTTTPATDGPIEAGWLRPGLHLTAVGSDAEHKRELSPEAVLRADLFVCDALPQSRRLGELRAVEEAGRLDEVRPVELGAVTGGRHPGRERDEQVTVCDLTGTGMQDTVIARLALAAAERMGLGTRVEA